MDYTNGTKATWRFWVWKRLRERLRGVHPSHATVLFLAGPSPEDLHAATKNGFRLENIVAVDSSLDAVMAARKAGCTAIQGDIHDVVTFWNDGDIHGCVADYCSGLTHQLFLCASEMFWNINGPTVLNFQRGRESDESSRRIRKYLYSRGISKHRGEQFVAMMLHCIAGGKHKNMFWGKSHFAHKDLIHYCMSLIPSMSLEKVFELSAWTHTMMAPLYYSYTSNVVKMDTVVVSNLLSRDENQMLAYRDLMHQCKEVIGSIESGTLMKLEPHERKFVGAIRAGIALSRRLNAAKAVRTMNGAVRLRAIDN